MASRASPQEEACRARIDGADAPAARIDEEQARGLNAAPFLVRARDCEQVVVEPPGKTRIATRDLRLGSWPEPDPCRPPQLVVRDREAGQVDLRHAPSVDHEGTAPTRVDAEAGWLPLHLVRRHRLETRAGEDPLEPDEAHAAEFVGDSEPRGADRACRRDQHHQLLSCSVDPQNRAAQRAARRDSPGSDVDREQPLPLRATDLLEGEQAPAREPRQSSDRAASEPDVSGNAQPGACCSSYTAPRPPVPVRSAGRYLRT